MQSTKIGQEKQLDTHAQVLPNQRCRAGGILKKGMRTTVPGKRQDLTKKKGQSMEQGFDEIQELRLLFNTI